MRRCTFTEGLMIVNCGRRGCCRHRPRSKRWTGSAQVLRRAAFAVLRGCSHRAATGPASQRTATLS